MPCAAIVPYAEVISSGETGCDPSVIEQTGSSGETIPSRCAARTTASGPTFTTSWAKIVFTELAVASMRLIVPADSSAELLTSQGWKFVEQRGSGMSSEGGPLNVDDIEMPCSIAAASVKGLKALPA